MPAVNIATTATKALTVPKGRWGFRARNNSDTTIYYRLAKTVATSGSDMGMPLDPGAEITFCLAEAALNDLSVQAIHGGSGSKVLVYDILDQQVQATFGGGQSTALIAGDVQIGAVELKNGSTDQRAIVNSLGALLTADTGPGWTPARLYTAISTATTTDITAAPTSGQKIVLDDCLISCDAACAVSIVEETSGTVFAKVFVPANGTVQITLRNAIKAAVADKKLRAITSAAVNTSITATWHSEA